MRGSLTLPRLGFYVLAVFWGMLVVAPVAHAVAPTGACCFRDGSCQDLTSTQCDAQGAEFIDATSCSQINCAAPLAAPMLSIFGTVALLGALCGLGVYRLTFGRRAKSARS
jgi:hypothetical protein